MKCRSVAALPKRSPIHKRRKPVDSGRFDAQQRNVVELQTECRNSYQPERPRPSDVVFLRP